MDVIPIESHITATEVDICCGRALGHGQDHSYTAAGPACGWGSAKFPAREGEAQLPNPLVEKVCFAFRTCLDKLLEQSWHLICTAAPAKLIFVKLAGEVRCSAHSIISLCFRAPDLCLAKSGVGQVERQVTGQI